MRLGLFIAGLYFVMACAFLIALAVALSGDDE